MVATGQQHAATEVSQEKYNAYQQVMPEVESYLKTEYVPRLNAAANAVISVRPDLNPSQQRAIDRSLDEALKRHTELPSMMGLAVVGLASPTQVAAYAAQPLGEMLAVLGQYQHRRFAPAVEQIQAAKTFIESSAQGAT